MQRGKRPYARFGQRLSEIRNELNESVYEVSGAVEVETETIEKFEKGESRPSEDLLMLLISHFDVKDEEADELFKLAGYDMNDTFSEDPQALQPIVVMQIDSRILYSEKTTVEANENGVVLNFLQNGMNGQLLPISRIGMSHSQANQLIENLKSSLERATGSHRKLLDSPKSKKVSKNKKSSK